MTSPVASLYETDLHAWAMQNAALIRSGRLGEADLMNIAEELESMGRSERRALANRLAVLLMHLLKWRYPPALRGKSWQATIKEQRRQVMKLLQDSPSLKPNLPVILADVYEDAVLMAIAETHLDETTFPSNCPFSLEQVLDQNYWPA